MDKILIISAHADDETFGMGGTMLKYALDVDCKLYWLIVTQIWAPKWTEDQINSRQKAIHSISKLIKFEDVIKWRFKDNLLDTISKNELQEQLIKVLDTIKPNVIFTPSYWDFNFEHRLVCELVEMCTKAYYSKYIEEIIAYEIPSSTEVSFPTHRNFPVNCYVDIAGFIDKKIELINYFSTECNEFPHPRSSEYIKVLAKKRGAESGLSYAEGFHILRIIKK